MKRKKIIVLGIICMVVIGASIGYKLKSKVVVKTNTIVVSSNKSKIIHKSLAEFDSERPDKSIIKSSDKGENVRRIQTRLKKYGYNVVVDGDYGEGVIYAVMDFQQRHNIIPSGKVTVETIDAMYKTPTEDNMYKPAIQTFLSSNDVALKSTYESKLNSGENTSSTNNYILVDLSQQRVYIFYGSLHNWKLINTFSCGSGKAETPTVTGLFRVGIKGLNFKSGTAASPVYCKYFTQISGNYLFHSILYDKNGNVIDGNLGAVESHGCIRLALENAKYIYNNIPIGSTIWVK